MNPTDSPRQLIGDALTQVMSLTGGVRGLMSMIAMLMATSLAVFMPIPACYELWLVRQVQTWPEVPVQLESVELERSSFSRGELIWRYRLRDIQTGAKYNTSDAEPGDIPLTVAAWSSKHALWSDRNNDAARYRAHVGQVIRVRRSPDGLRYFLRPGNSRTMTFVLTLCAAFWTWILLIRRSANPLPPALRRHRVEPKSEN